MVDALVIGAGHNGLVAANVLADAGWSVEVLEAADSPGGAVRSGEFVEAGHISDFCSAFYPMTALSPVMDSLDLGAHGLRWVHAPLVLAHPADDGTCPVLSTDPAVTHDSLADCSSPGDAEAWDRLYQRWLDLAPGLVPAVLGPFPPVRALAKLARRVPPREIPDLLRFFLLPVRRLGEEEFTGEAARRLLAGAALHADFSPESTLSGFFGWLMCAAGQQVGFPVPVGGAQSITDALVRRLEAGGGRVRCGAPVTEVVVRHGRAAGVRVGSGSGGEELRADRAVLADVNAPMLYRSLVAADHLPARLLAAIERFDWDDATFKVDWTLDEPIPWKAAGARQAGTVHVSEDVDHLSLCTSGLARGAIPAEPFLLVGQQSIADPTRQPAGHDTAWAYTHVPRKVRRDSGGSLTGVWDRVEADAFAERVEDQIEKLAPGFRDCVRRRHVTTPPAFEAENPNLDGSAIQGGTEQLHQQLVFRPVPGTGRPGTPIAGLYLASSSAHPGGAVHGVCGSNAARAAIAGDRVRRASVWLTGRRR